MYTPVLRAFKERIRLLSQQTQASADGVATKKCVECARVWAAMQQIRHEKIPMLASACGLTLAPKAMFRVFVRAPLEMPNAPNRQLKINALGWRGKVFRLLSPFSAWGCAGSFLEALCIEEGEDS